MWSIKSTYLLTYLLKRIHLASNRCVRVPECRDGDERVHGDVGRRVRGEADQLAGHVAERPAVRGVLVGHERRADDQEVEVGDGEVQQQEVGGAGAHVRRGGDDVDDERVAGDADH